MNAIIFKKTLMYSAFTFSGLTFGYIIYQDLRGSELIYTLCTAIGSDLAAIGILIDLKFRNTEKTA